MAKQHGGFTVIPGGDRYFRVGGRHYTYVRHLQRDCPHLRRAQIVNEVREVDLWPGFICETCRIRDGARAA